MEKRYIDGLPFVVVQGHIETTAHGIEDIRGAYIPTVQFSDGTVLRNVYLDSLSSPYFEGGMSGTFAFNEYKGKLYLIGAEYDGVGFRPADVHAHSQIARQTQTMTTVGVVITALAFYLGWQASLTTSLAVGAIPALFTLLGLRATSSSGTHLKLVQALARAKGIPSGHDGSVSGDTSLASPSRAPAA
jgi:hypothetical protein